jgi:ferritin-like metal-binding protein YciE
MQFRAHFLICALQPAAELAGVLTRCTRKRRLLQQTQDMEKAIDNKLTALAESKINRRAA